MLKFEDVLKNITKKLPVNRGSEPVEGPALCRDVGLGQDRHRHLVDVTDRHWKDWPWYF